MWQYIQMAVCMYVCGCVWVCNLWPGMQLYECVKLWPTGREFCANGFYEWGNVIFSKNAKENNNTNKHSNEWRKKYDGIANLARSAILSVENYVVFTCHWPQLEVITEPTKTKGCDIFSLQKLIISDSVGLCVCVCDSMCMYVWSYVDVFPLYGLLIRNIRCIPLLCVCLFQTNVWYKFILKT